MLDPRPTVSKVAAFTGPTTYRDPKARKQATQGTVAQEFSVVKATGQMPPNVAVLLAPYVRRTVATKQG